MVFITPSVFVILATLFFVIATAAAPSPPTFSSELSSKHRRASQASTWLSAHNAVREAHGADPLTWSPILAAKAQLWANGCEFRHTDGILSSEPYGENIVAGTGNFPIVSAVGQFTKDASHYNPESPTYTHWTQVVWKSTTQLGCATARCDGIFDPQLGKATLHVCLYNPAGNVVGDTLANVQL